MTLEVTQMSEMSAPWTALDPGEITDNVFRLIGTDWMLITAGDLDACNTMTASWGALGVLWGKPVAFCVIRPQRHTRAFIDPATAFTLTFFEEKYRAALTLCGSKSGRDMDKIAAAGLTPQLSPGGSVYFSEARLVFDCRKLYTQDFDPAGFVDTTLDGEIYPTGDYHRLYVGEITGCWQK
jgi:flavin reductase (DIM6/NTAB) family NADH-FMN oxidoreductase RutF